MRLKSKLWVQAYLRLCQLNNAPAVVVRKGQADGGAIYIKISRLDDTIDLYTPAPAGLDAANARLWTLDETLTAASEDDAGAYLDRQIKYDPDIWIIEVEDRQGRHFLGDALVSV